jgi:hypothetical protein
MGVLLFCISAAATSPSKAMFQVPKRYKVESRRFRFSLCLAYLVWLLGVQLACFRFVFSSCFWLPSRSLNFMEETKWIVGGFDSHSVYYMWVLGVQMACFCFASCPDAMAELELHGRDEMDSRRFCVPFYGYCILIPACGRRASVLLV